MKFSEANIKVDNIEFTVLYNHVRGQMQTLEDPGEDEHGEIEDIKIGEHSILDLLNPKAIDEIETELNRRLI